MKLRIAGNELRLRLAAEEVDALARGEDVAESVALAPKPLTYRVTPADHTRATFDGSTIVVEFERSACTTWARGTENSFGVSEAGLSILIEKDLPCRKHVNTSVD